MLELCSGSIIFLMCLTCPDILGIEGSSRSQFWSGRQNKSLNCCWVYLYSWICIDLYWFESIHIDFIYVLRRALSICELFASLWCMPQAFVSPGKCRSRICQVCSSLWCMLQALCFPEQCRSRIYEPGSQTTYIKNTYSRPKLSATCPDILGIQGSSKWGLPRRW